MLTRCAHRAGIVLESSTQVEVGEESQALLSVSDLFTPQPAVVELRDTVRPYGEGDWCWAAIWW